MSVCYKRYMRKWMSERLKRRKKVGDTPAENGTKKPEPLQPRFYDDEPPPADAAPAEAIQMQTRRAAKQEPPPEPVTVAEPIMKQAVATPAAESRGRISRRRRGRGGRGGSRRPAAAPSDVAGASPAVGGSGPEPGTPAPSDFVSAPEVFKQHRPSQVAVTPVAPAQTPAVAPSKGTVVLAIGLPGSGKSSWFKRHNIHPLSSDLLRELLFDDAQEQRFQDLIFSNLRSMLKARLIARRPMNYVDATNLTPHDRHSWIKLAKDYGYDVQGVFFDVPLDVCMERHQRRGRVVPEDIMRKMASKLKPPTFEEGFSKITVVRVKQKE
jgi:predicted kinase